MKTVRTLLVAFMLGCMAAAALGQDLVTTSEITGTTDTYSVQRFYIEADGEIAFESVTEGDVESSVESTGQLIVIDSPARNIRVTAETQGREPANDVLQRLPGRNRYLITEPGRYWVRVTAIDFQENIFDETTVIVEIEGAPGPGPDPDPIDPTSELADKVAQAVRGLSRNNDLAGSFLAAASRLESFESLTIADTREQLMSDFDRFAGEYGALIDLLEEETSGITFGRQAVIDFYKEVARGLGVQRVQSTAPPVFSIPPYQAPVPMQPLYIQPSMPMPMPMPMMSGT